MFSLSEPGYIYTRLNNPTNDVLEQRLAALEGGVAAVATASGTAAIATTLMMFLKTGDHIVASNSLYGGTYNLLSNTLPRLALQLLSLIQMIQKTFLKQCRKIQELFLQSL